MSISEAKRYICLIVFISLFFPDFIASTMGEWAT